MYAENQKNLKRNVYDIFKEIGEKSSQIAKDMFVMAGQRGMANGYFFEIESSRILSKLIDIVVFDESGENEVGKLHGKEAAFRAFYFEPPKWIEPGKNYHVKYPDTPEEDVTKLRELRDGILDRLKIDGMDAASDFYLFGIAVGGKEQDSEEIAKDIDAQFVEIQRRPTK